jgi:dolichyl-phosphate beta-glucosyltransferase
VAWLSVVVPAYREADHIAATVQAISSSLDAYGRPWELFVVDNGSDDGTADAAASGDPRVVVLGNGTDRGKGYSLRRGMLAATGGLRLHCDADCAPSFASLDGMLARIDSGADLVVGSRLAAGADVGMRQPLRRRVVGRAFQELGRRALHLPVRDAYCGYKLWRGEVAEEVYSRTSLDGWVFDAETIALAQKFGHRVEEHGIVWTDRPGSRLSMPRVLVPAVRDLLRARRHVRAAVPAPQVAPAEPVPDPA